MLGCLRPFLRYTCLRLIACVFLRVTRSRNRLPASFLTSHAHAIHYLCLSSRHTLTQYITCVFFRGYSLAITDIFYFVTVLTLDCLRVPRVTIVKLLVSLLAFRYYAKIIALRKYTHKYNTAVVLMKFCSQSKIYELQYSHFKNHCQVQNHIYIT